VNVSEMLSRNALKAVATQSNRGGFSYSLNVRHNRLCSKAEIEEHYGICRSSVCRIYAEHRATVT